MSLFSDDKKRLQVGHRTRDLDERLAAKNRIKLSKNVFSTKK